MTGAHRPPSGAGLLRVLAGLLALAAISSGVAAGASVLLAAWWNLGGCIMAMLALVGCTVCAWLAAGDAARSAASARSALASAQQLRDQLDYERAMLMQMAGLVLVVSGWLPDAASLAEWRLLLDMARSQGGRLESIANR